MSNILLKLPKLGVDINLYAKTVGIDLAEEQMADFISSCNNSNEIGAMFIDSSLSKVKDLIPHSVINTIDTANRYNATMSDMLKLYYNGKMSRAVYNTFIILNMDTNAHSIQNKLISNIRFIKLMSNDSADSDDGFSHIIKHDSVAVESRDSKLVISDGLGYSDYREYLTNLHANFPDFPAVDVVYDNTQDLLNSATKKMSATTAEHKLTNIAGVFNLVRRRVDIEVGLVSLLDAGSPTPVSCITPIPISLFLWQLSNDKLEGETRSLANNYSGLLQVIFAQDAPLHYEQFIDIKKMPKLAAVAGHALYSSIVATADFAVAERCNARLGGGVNLYKNYVTMRIASDDSTDAPTECRHICLAAFSFYCFGAINNLHDNNTFITHISSIKSREVEAYTAMSDANQLLSSDGSLPQLISSCVGFKHTVAEHLIDQMLATKVLNLDKEDGGNFVNINYSDIRGQHHFIFRDSHIIFNEKIDKFLLIGMNTPLGVSSLDVEIFLPDTMAKIFKDLVRSTRELYKGKSDIADALKKVGVDGEFTSLLAIIQVYACFSKFIFHSNFGFFELLQFCRQSLYPDQLAGFTLTHARISTATAEMAYSIVSSTETIVESASPIVRALSNSGISSSDIYLQRLFDEGVSRSEVLRQVVEDVRILPTGVCALIGRAGTGKSSFLDHIYKLCALNFQEPELSWTSPAILSALVSKLSFEFKHNKKQYLRGQVVVIDSLRLALFTSVGSAQKGGVASGFYSLIQWLDTLARAYDITLIIAIGPQMISADEHVFSAFIESLKAACSSVFEIENLRSNGRLLIGSGSLSRRRPSKARDKQSIYISVRKGLSDGFIPRIGFSIDGNIQHVSSM